MFIKTSFQITQCIIDFKAFLLIINKDLVVLYFKIGNIFQWNDAVFITVCKN